jgi:TonB family protein
MSITLAWNNLVTYSLQIGLLIGLAAFIPALVRMRMPHARLAYWQLLLLACLALPVVRPWQQAVADTAVQVTTVVTTTAIARAPHRQMPSGQELLLLLLAVGIVGRLGWLGVGFWRLGHYRRHARPLRGRIASADLLISDEIPSPVTFGFLKPVILLPARFSELSGEMQDAILCHESLHVARHDWLFTVGEELVRALFWFHPAIWWLLGEIQLSREQAVDRLVIATLESREPYVDALLTMAGARPELDLAPAPLFLRKRHLKQRVVGILKEVRMSKMRWISALAVSLAIMAAACWFVTGAIPLAAEPQGIVDGAGVTVNTNGATLMHRPSVLYPSDAQAKGIQGTVLVELKVDGNGEVADANVLSGPPELRRGVLQSVLSWHFTKDSANTARTVNVVFSLPPGAPNQATGSAADSATAAMVALAPGVANLQVKRIDISGLSDEARDQLLALLPVHVGDTISADTVPNIVRTAREFDSHLVALVVPDVKGGGAIVHIIAPSARPVGGVTGGVVGGIAGAVLRPAESADANTPPQRIRVGGNVQAVNLVSGPKPTYPPMAKQAHIQGKVELAAVIGKDGKVVDLKVISGHPLLVQASLDAVRDWVYRPTLLNGNPVEVSTTIDVNYTLSDNPPPVAQDQQQ